MVRVCALEIAVHVPHEQNAEISEEGTGHINVKKIGAKGSVLKCQCIFLRQLLELFMVFDVFLSSLYVGLGSVAYHSHHIIFLLSGRSFVPLGIISNPTQKYVQQNKRNIICFCLEGAD